MISSLWIAKTGLDAQQTNMDVIANNGKRQHQWFQAPACGFRRFALSNDSSAGAQSSEQTTLPSGLQIGTGVRPVATERLHSRATCPRPTTVKTLPSKVRVSSGAAA